MLEGPQRSAGLRLPLELIEQICVLAAEEHRKSAHQLAYVSRAVCQATAKARWRVIAITSVEQYMAFYREIQAIPDRQYNLVVDAIQQVDHASSLRLKKVQSFKPEESGAGAASDHEHSDKTGRGVSLFDLLAPAADKTQRIKRRGHTISFPSSGEPHESIQHLYITLPEITAASQATHGLGSGWFFFASKCHEALKLSIDPIRGIKTSNAIADVARLLVGLDDLSLDHLSLGPGAEAVLGWVSNDCQIKEVTAVYTSFTNSDLILRESLQRLHIIGLDLVSKTSGIPPPWTDLTLLGIESLETQHLTHLRFDTRKFSFKPAEIFASRLRPLLQEVTVETQSHPSPEVKAEDTYRHDGPRHAAPSRGAGHSQYYNRTTSTLTPVYHLRGDPRADYLRELMGVGRLDFLQFAWDPMSTSERREEDVPAYQKARYSAIDQRDDERTLQDTGGWPREMRGAWTERSDRDIAPSFAVELRDAISSLYGWHTPGVEPAGKFVARKDAMPPAERREAKNVAFSPDHAGEMVMRIKNGFKEADQLALSELQEDLKEVLTGKGLDVSCKLKYGVRAPQSLIHLGGKAPFEPEDRLALFEDRARGSKGAWP